MNFKKLRNANILRNIEWNPDNKVTPTFRGLELSGEVGEACNIIKKLERERIGIRGGRATIEELEEELSDIMICVDLIAMDYNINLDRAVSDKFNKTSKKYDLKTLIED